VLQCDRSSVKQKQTLSPDVSQPLKPSADLYEEPSRREGYAIVRGRRPFDHDIQPQSIESTSSSTSSEAGAELSHRPRAAADKRDTGRFSIMRGR